MYVYEIVLKWCKQWCNALSVRLRQVLRRKNLLCVAYYNIKRYRFFLESRTVLELKSVKPIIHSQIRSTVLSGLSKIGVLVLIGPMNISVQSRSGPKFEKITHKRVLKDISSWSKSVLVWRPLAISNIYSGEIRHFIKSPESFRFVPTCDSV